MTLLSWIKDNARAIGRYVIISTLALFLLIGCAYIDYYTQQWFEQRKRNEHFKVIGICGHNIYVEGRLKLIFINVTTGSAIKNALIVLSNNESGYTNEHGVYYTKSWFASGECIEGYVNGVKFHAQIPPIQQDEYAHFEYILVIVELGNLSRWREVFSE